METKQMQKTFRMLNQLQIAYPELNEFIIPNVKKSTQRDIGAVDISEEYEEYEQMPDILQNVTLNDIIDRQPHLLKYYILISLIQKSNL